MKNHNELENNYKEPRDPKNGFVKLVASMAIVVVVAFSLVFILDRTEKEEEDIQTLPSTEVIEEDLELDINEDELPELPEVEEDIEGNFEDLEEPIDDPTLDNE